jgi:hypothetical protein
LLAKRSHPQFVLLEDRLNLRPLNAHLRELVDRIEVFACGHPHPYDGDTETGDDFEEWFEEAIRLANPSFRPDKQFRQFAAYVVRRRMTKEGRFLRVHFRTGSKVDIVPPGSIASGMVDLPLPRRGSHFIEPDIAALWQSFIKSNGRATPLSHPKAAARNQR